MRAVRLDSRLRRLEAAVPTGCPACRDRRGRAFFRFYRQFPDGTVVPADAAPLRCERCGEVPEEVVELIEVVVSPREEWERFRADWRYDVGAVP